MSRAKDVSDLLTIAVRAGRCLSPAGTIMVFLCIIASLTSPLRAEDLASQKASHQRTKGDVERFCGGALATAMDARAAWEKSEIEAMEKGLSARSDLLADRISKLKTLVDQQKSFAAKAREETVTIYAKMRPEAAASQLSQMPEEDAASVIYGLPPATASRVLAEMEPARAARLAEIVARAGLGEKRP